MSHTFLTLNDADLPPDLFSLTDNHFYQFVRKRLGDYQARLIEIQRISCMSVFLMTDDICGILEIDVEGDEFNDLKNDLCFRLRDGSFLVKPGIRSSFECLKKLILKKAEERTKEKRKQKSQQKAESQISTDASKSSSVSVSSIQIPSVESNSIASSESVFNTEKSYLLKLIDKWCQSNKEGLNLDDFRLVDGVDFHVNLLENKNEIEGNIVCKCGVMTRLPRCNSQLQLSNYYKHLKGTKCSFMKEVKKRNKEMALISSPFPSISSKRAVDDTQSSSTSKKRQRFMEGI